MTICLGRDKGSGSVEIDANGQPRVHYTISDHDRKSLEDGVQKMLRVAVASGATEVGTLQQNMGSFCPTPATGSGSADDMPAGVADPAFQEYCAKVQKVGVKPNSCGLFSAHQMGTCRMGVDPATSAVDQDGQSWEVRNLYVADASTFPTPSGANPMVTTLSIAHMVAQGIKKKIGLTAVVADTIPQMEEAHVMVPRSRL